jgi:hypothetical protein
MHLDLDPPGVGETSGSAVDDLDGDGRQEMVIGGDGSRTGWELTRKIPGGNFPSIATWSLHTP